MNEILFKEESYAIIGLCMEVHNDLDMVFQKLFIKMLWKLE